MGEVTAATRSTVAYVRMRVQDPRTDEDPVQGYVVLHNAQITCSGRFVEGIRWQGQTEECGFTLPMEQVVWIKWLEPENGSEPTGGAS